jgi:hypothetical protein
MIRKANSPADKAQKPSHAKSTINYHSEQSEEEYKQTHLTKAMNSIDKE